METPISLREAINAALSAELYLSYADSKEEEDKELENCLKKWAIVEKAIKELM